MTKEQKRQSAKISAIVHRLILGDMPERIEYMAAGNRWMEVVEPHEIRAAMKRPHPHQAGTVGEAYEAERSKIAAELKLESDAMEALLEREDRENQAALAAGEEL